ncbi:hypothetical protein ACROYT_G005874 [Oculina patagonica]
MGSCNSIITASKISKNDEIKGVEEIEETPVVEIYIKCPSDTGSWQSLEIREATETTAKMSSTIEVKDIESVDEFLPDKSSILSVNDCDVVLSQAEVLEVRGEHHGPRQCYDVQEQPTTKTILNTFTTISKKEIKLEIGNNGDEECSRELPGTSGGEVHGENVTELSKKKAVSQVKKGRKLRILSFKRIQKSIRRKRVTYSRRRHFITEVLPANKDLARIYDPDGHGDGNDSSSSVSPASTRSSSAASPPSRNKSFSIASVENLEELGKRESGKEVEKGGGCD